MSSSATSKPSFVPSDFAIPATLEHELFRLRMLSATDAEADYDAVMATQARLRQGSPHGWPHDGFTLRENLIDLERHEQEFLDRVAFAYTMLRPETDQSQPAVLGCVYINPPVSSPAAGGEAEVYMWVRDEYHPTLTTTLFERVDEWLKDTWPFETVRYIRTEYYLPEGHAA